MEHPGSTVIRGRRIRINTACICSIPDEGQFFTLMNSTVGMKMLWKSLAKGWSNAASVIAVVNLATRLFRTAKWGTKYRPDLQDP